MITEWLLNHLPEWCTGKQAEYENRYQVINGGSSSAEQIREDRKKLLWSYISVLTLFLLFCLGCCDGETQQGKLDRLLQRPAYGQPDKKVKLEVKGMYENATVRREVLLKVRPRQLTEKEVNERLERCGRKLKGQILGENKSYDAVASNLYLPKADGETGVQISWSCDQPELVDSSGTLNMIRIREPVWIELTALLSLGIQKKEYIYRCQLMPGADRAMKESALNTEIKSLVRQISGSKLEDAVSLPEAAEHGISLSWRVKEQNGLFGAVLFTGLLLVYLFRNRYRLADARLVQYRSRLQEGFPAVVTELVLLLNAGLVVTTAFEKIGGQAKRSKSNLLIAEIEQLMGRMKAANGSLAGELLCFAQRSGVRELMRLASIVNDNMDKGSALCDKLETEGQLLWMNHKKQAEIKGKTMDSKLIMPLAMLLIILVTITIAPVFIEI